MIAAPEFFAEIETIYNVIEKQQCKSVAFTASQSGEGVTEIVLVTAKRYAKMGRSILIIDMNGFRPRLSSGMTTDWNVGDFASQAESISELADNICLLPYPLGEVKSNIAFRDKSKIRNMLSFWSENYDLIIFDTCPVMQINAANIPAQLLAACCDGNFLIVAPGITKESNLLKAITVLSDDNVAVLGIIVNDFSSPPLNVQITRTIQQRLNFFPYLQRCLLQAVEKFDLLTGKFGR